MASSAMANHLKGGWIQYKYIGPGAAANTSRYDITVRQYLDCGSNAGQRDASVFLGVFNSNRHCVLTLGLHIMQARLQV